MIRTHDAGALRAEHVGQTVTLAGWVARRRDHGGVAFLDLREASGVVQVVVRDEAVAHSLRSEYCLKVTGEVVAAPARATRTRTCPPARSRSIADRRRGAQRRRAAAVPDRRARRRWGRRPGSSTATSTCAAPAPTPALRLRSKVNKAARDVLDGHGFVEIETPDADPLDARGRPRLPGARPGCSPAAGTPCRRARSCSSSC